MTRDIPEDQAEHTRRTREVYDQLAAVWSETTDDGPFNGWLERPALRSLVPPGLSGAAGFAVDRVAEPQPSAEAVGRFPGELSGLVGVPTFIVYRLLLQS